MGQQKGGKLPLTVPHPRMVGHLPTASGWRCLGCSSWIRGRHPARRRLLVRLKGQARRIAAIRRFERGRRTRGGRGGCGAHPAPPNWRAGPEPPPTRYSGRRISCRSWSSSRRSRGLDGLTARCVRRPPASPSHPRSSSIPSQSPPQPSIDFGTHRVLTLGESTGNAEQDEAMILSDCREGNLRGARSGNAIRHLRWTW